MRFLENLEPEIQVALRAQGERDLARRTVFGAMVYFVVVVVVAWGTVYYPDHPDTILVFGALTLVLGAGRLGAALRMRDNDGPALYRWGGPLRRFTEAEFAVWGAFAWWTLELYRFDHVSLLVLMSTAAFSGGATSSLCPDLALARRGLLLLLLPPTIWCAFEGNREGVVLVVFGSVYLAFLMLQVREHHRAYWTTSVSAAKAAAAEGDRLFRVAFETANAGMALIDGEGHFRQVNQRLCEKLSRSESELLGSTFQSLLHDPDRGLEWFEALQVGVAAREREEQFDGGGGELLWCAVSVAAVGGGPQGPRYYVAMIQNITARMRAEDERNEMAAQLRQAQKLESIGTLAGGIAHDFNNLLALMMGYAELAAEKLPKSPAVADLREIVQAGERAAILVDQLLEFSRRQLTQPEILNLNQIVSERHELLRHTAGGHIQVDLSLDSTLQDVEVDAGQFERLLLNLVLNARDAMPEGGLIKIATRMVPGPTGDGEAAGAPWVALAVADTGCGMDAETRTKAFEPFFTTKKLGSGLGLASVYGIVKQSGGEIRIESEPARGTTVEILLPRASGKAVAAGTPTGVQAVEPRTAPENAAVLVAEDEPGLRRLTETILVSSGYQVSAAGDGPEAFGIFLQDPARFDVLLTDVVMPGMSGRRLADEIRQKRPGMRVVYMTSYSASEIAEQGVVEPSVTVLAKPFSAEELRRAMRRVLAEESSEAQG